MPDHAPATAPPLIALSADHRGNRIAVELDTDKYATLRINGVLRGKQRIAAASRGIFLRTTTQVDYEEHDEIAARLLLHPTAAEALLTANGHILASTYRTDIETGVPAGPLDLAKPCIDVGLQTNRTQAMLAFWRDQVGLAHEELLKVSGGIHQHRHHMNGAVLKLNSVREPLPDDAPTGILGLSIAIPGLAAATRLQDPDGNRILLVPAAADGIEQVAIDLAARNLEQSLHFYTDCLKLTDEGRHRDGSIRLRWGRTLLRLIERPDRQTVGELRGVGLRYLTVQVFDADAAHRHVLANGGREGAAPRTLGETTRISFVRDPDGNWIEISQRASLTGRLD